MGCSRITCFILLTIFLSSISSSSSRKLLEEDHHEKLKNSATPQQPYLDANQFLTSLPKGSVPASTPSKKGHSFTTDEKLVARHLAEQERILRSVPSPGIGH
ncbi:OLC1v1021238C1 [Oldenlandia corymbosa var. corymbosa]|uniref:OLC1v1021238C1 n=1 Tax=Oldenlandia corymbosa var. corymbosa TaxID=529605 RepID=A0AAV1BXM9_OLDCO|nr:OLC1v1021238C1 [Oldenlandia corymbosa var. corymbosa]